MEPMSNSHPFHKFNWLLSLVFPIDLWHT